MWSQAASIAHQADNSIAQDIAVKARQDRATSRVNLTDTEFAGGELHTKLDALVEAWKELAGQGEEGREQAQAQLWELLRQLNTQEVSRRHTILSTIYDSGVLAMMRANRASLESFVRRAENCGADRVAVQLLFDLASQQTTQHEIARGYLQRALTLSGDANQVYRLAAKLEVVLSDDTEPNTVTESADRLPRSPRHSGEFDVPDARQRTSPRLGAMVALVEEEPVDLQEATTLSALGYAEIDARHPSLFDLPPAKLTPVDEEDPTASTRTFIEPTLTRTLIGTPPAPTVPDTAEVPAPSTTPEAPAPAAAAPEDDGFEPSELSRQRLESFWEQNTGQMQMGATFESRELVAGHCFDVHSEEEGASLREAAGALRSFARQIAQALGGSTVVVALPTDEGSWHALIEEGDVAIFRATFGGFGRAMRLSEEVVKGEHA
ncbi:hypothetical protein DL240_10465 [Lujinxingia litoralis]|uniref:Uncharacterized protein n=1 Tax=Lujinxingia litoralis TaxID=2211119 RepID=A0A328C6T9_9DELT|nr:hypothetical protein [Lujinxingia litoralis]RAL22268.1 hypothetical protein DL240_10465 [Lujinxingia litoralis]